MSRSLKKTAIVVAVFLVTAPLVRYIWIHEMMWSIAAYHILDVPPEKASWFTFFFWASWSIPALWVVSLMLVIVEATRKQRWFVFAGYTAAPFLGAAVYWIGWQAFLICLSRTPA